MDLEGTTTQLLDDSDICGMTLGEVEDREDIIFNEVYWRASGQLSRPEIHPNLRLKEGMIVHFYHERGDLVKFAHMLQKT